MIELPIRGPLHALPLHASAVVVDGGALLFLGPSGAGKSTIRRLLEGRAVPLADDAIFLRHRPEGRWGVSPADGRAFHGPLSEEEMAGRSWTPLRAFFRLHQAKEMRLEALPPWEACRFLVSAFFEAYWPQYCDFETQRHAFAELAGLARTMPGYRLYFGRSRHAAKTLGMVLREAIAENAEAATAGRADAQLPTPDSQFPIPNFGRPSDPQTLLDLCPKEDHP